MCAHPGAWLPQWCHPSPDSLAKSSSLFWEGNIRSIRLLISSGFCECLFVRFVMRNCFSFLDPLGFGMQPFFLMPVITISFELMV